jgi:hypothetical protein
MKAKVKATGKVIEVTLDGCITDGYNEVWNYKDNDGKLYSLEGLDFINIYPDWQQVRITSCIAAMQGLLSNDKFCVYSEKDIAKYAVKQSDALIEELKKTM